MGVGGSSTCPHFLWPGGPLPVCDHAASPGHVCLCRDERGPRADVIHTGVDLAWNWGPLPFYPKTGLEKTFFWRPYPHHPFPADDMAQPRRDVGHPDLD